MSSSTAPFMEQQPELSVTSVHHEQNENSNRVGFASVTLSTDKDTLEAKRKRHIRGGAQKRPLKVSQIGGILVDSVRAKGKKEDHTHRAEGVLTFSTDIKLNTDVTNTTKQADIKKGKKENEIGKPNQELLRKHPEPNQKNESPEKNALRRLRSRLQSYESNPMYQYVFTLPNEELLAWLRAFDLNVNVVESQLVNHCLMRKKIGLIPDYQHADYKPPEILSKYYTGGFCGEDKEQCPIWYELLGMLNIDNLVNAVQLHDLIRFKFHQFEKMKQVARNAGLSQVLLIVDMKGMSISNFGPSTEIWAHFINIMQDHYPYIFKEIILINVPTGWTEFALALRPYVNRQTRSKITVIRNKCLKYLLNRIEKHNIPAYLKGYKCDLDNNPYCKEDLNWEGKIPLWMFRSDNLHANLRPFVIPGGERLIKETCVTASGSHVIFEMLSLNQAVTVVLFLAQMDEECVVIREKMTADFGHLAPQVMGLPNLKAGRYFMVIDNSSNFASVAKGCYVLTIHPPNWINAKNAMKSPLGDCFDMSDFIGEEEKKVLRWKHAKERHFTWVQDQVIP